MDSLEIQLEKTSFDTLANVEIRIEDPPGPNWYMVNVQLLDGEYDLRDQPYTELLDDQQFDGNTVDLSFRVLLGGYDKGDSLFVSMANISQEYYDFLELRKEQENELFDGLNEPFNFPSNVENGLGFFHMHVQDARIRVLDE